MNLVWRFILPGLLAVPFLISEAVAAEEVSTPQIAKGINFAEYDVLTPTMSAESYATFEARAAKDDPAALDIVFFANYMGCGRHIDRTEALKWLPRAIKAGAPLATVMRISESRDLPVEYRVLGCAKREELCRQLTPVLAPLAETKSEFALYTLSLCIASTREYIKAMPVITPVAERGNAYAQLLLAEEMAAYNADTGVAQPEKRKWCEKAAHQGVIGAMVMLGHIYSRSEKPEIEKEVELCQKAADAGSPEALFDLSTMYESGMGVPRNSKKAFEFAIKAAEAGDMIAYDKLARMYAQGVGVAPDMKEAVKWAQKMVDCKTFSSPINAVNVGLAYLYGWGVAEDWDRGMQLIESFEALQKAVVSNEYPAWALENEGYIEECNEDCRATSLLLRYNAYARPGPHNDMKKANSFKEQALALRKEIVTNSIYYLGQAFGKGWGVKKSATDAAFWYTLGTELGHPGCMNKLARIYENGWGLPQDKAKAQELYEKANNLGWKDMDKSKLKRNGGVEPGPAVRNEDF